MDFMLLMLTEQSSTKKQKVDGESGMRSFEAGPSVIISEGLANFFGVGGREMLQSEVVRRIWEYIKVHNLEVGNQVDHHCLYHNAFNSASNITWIMRAMFL